MQKVIARLLSAIFTLALLGACSSGPEEHEVNGADWEAIMSAATDREYVWPLIVEEGVIRCPGAGRLVFVADGVEYALNGLAKGGGEYRDIDSIWADDPDWEGLKLDISDLISYGNTACGY